MNKKTLTKICLVCVMTMAAGSAYAASTTITGTTVIGGGSFSTSSNVTISIDSSDSSYAAYSQHLNGDRVFWGSNTDPRVYYTNKATGSTTSVTPSATMTAPSGYSSL